MKLSLFQNLYFSESVSAIHQATETRSVFLCIKRCLDTGHLIMAR